MKIVYIFSFIVLFFTSVMFTDAGFSSDTDCYHNFKLKCSKCHALPSPLGYSKNLWDDYVSRMAGKAKLKEDEKKCIMSMNSTIIR